jgi:hypothetical protein
MAALCGLVLFARVYDEFPSTRWKVITDSAGRASDRGVLAIDIPYAEILAKQTTPIVVVARLENPAPNDVTINISWNDTNIGRTTVGGGDSKRVDLTLPAGVILRGDERLRFRGGGGDTSWKVTYLELANLYGSTRGAVSAMFVPAGVNLEPVVPWPFVLLIAGVLYAIAWQEGAAWTWKPARIAHAVVMGAIAVVFLASLLTPYVSNFKILIALKTFWIFTTLLFLRGLWRVVLAVRPAAARVLGSAAAFDSIIVALVCCGFFTAVMVIHLNTHYKGNYSGFLHLEKYWIATSPMLEGHEDLKKDLMLVDGGYDGMFMYVIAFDPFLSRFKDNPGRYEQVVDTPPYRYTRIGYSLLTKVFALDRPERFPVTMVWLILASHFLGALALGAIIRHHGGQPAWALLYIFVPGFMQSLNNALPESLAAAGLLTAIWLIAKKRFVVASVCFAATLLVRETSAIVVVTMVAWLWLSRRDWRGGFVVGLSIVPLLAWRAFITWRLFPSYGWSSFYFSPGNLTTPFKGVADLWDAIGRETYFLGFPPLALAGRMFPLLLGLALIVSLVLLWRRRDGLSAAAVAASVIAVCLDFPHVWTHVGNAERVTFDVFILLLAIFATMAGDFAGKAAAAAREGASLAPPASTRGLRVMLLGFFAATAIYTMYFSLDSPLVRRVLTNAIF